MKPPESNVNRRTLFTTDAKLAIRRKPPMKMAADQSSEQPTNDKVTLTGYAITWNTLSDDRGGFRVRLMPGSATFTDKVFALFHHSYESILGATANGTLRLSSDNVGVKVEIDLPNTQIANDIATLVEDKYINGMSFSMLFDPLPTSETIEEGGLEIMQVSSFLCDEVTITAIPAFSSTSITRQQDDELPADPQPEPAYARIEQTHQLDQLRLALMKI